MSTTTEKIARKEEDVRYGKSPVETMIADRLAFLKECKFNYGNYDAQWSNNEKLLRLAMLETLETLCANDEVIRREDAAMRLWEKDEIRKVVKGKRDHKDIWLVCFKNSNQVVKFVSDEHELPPVIPLRLTKFKDGMMQDFLRVIYNDEEPFMIS